MPSRKANQGSGSIVTRAKSGLESFPEAWVVLPAVWLPRQAAGSYNVEARGATSTPGGLILIMAVHRVLLDLGLSFPHLKNLRGNLSNPMGPITAVLGL